MSRITGIILLFILILGFVILRPVNPDEPYYTLASSQVHRGEIPYKDFLFHQTPLMLYVYSLISHFGYWSLILGRMFSIMFLLASFFLLYSAFVKRKLSVSIQGLFVFLFFLNGFFMDWMTVVRVYALSVFLLSLGLFFFHKFLISENSRKYLLLASLTFTLLVFVKITFIANLIVFICFSLYLIWKNKSPKKVSYFLWLLLPVFILPMLFMLSFHNSLDNVYFNLLTVNYINREYHLFSFESSLIRFLLFIFIPQNLLIIALIFISGWKFDFIEQFIIFNVLAYSGIHLFAQMLPEYLSVMIPFILLLAVRRYSTAESNLRKFWKNLTEKKIRYLLITLYLLFFFFSENNIRYHVLGKKELMPNAIELYILDQKLSGLKGETVLSSWWGYSAYLSKDQMIPMDYLSYYINNYVSKEDILRFRISTPKKCEEIIYERKADLIVYDSNNPLFLEKFASSIENNYIREWEYNKVTVFRKRDR